MEKTFIRNITIWFYNKFSTFIDFEKNSSFFSKKPICFSKNLQILNVLRILTILVAFYGKFATIWSKNDFAFSSVNKLGYVAWTHLANMG